MPSVEHDPALLARLGMAYLRAGLADHALKAFSRIPPDSSHYSEALGSLMKIHADAGNAEALLEAAQEAIRRGHPSLWPTRYLGLAAYWKGEYAKAAECFRRYLEYLPTNAEVQASLAGVQAGSRRPEIRTLLREALPWGLRPHGLLDSIVPLLWGGRAVTCGFEDITGFIQHAQTAPQQTRAWFLALARHLYEQLGVYTGFFRYLSWGGKSCAPMGKLVFSLDPSIYEALAGLEAESWAEFEGLSGDPAITQAVVEREGALLGYPPCCRTWAAQARGAGLTFENAALAALIEEEIKSEGAEPPLPPPGLAYFAYEFYPCRARCPAAEEIGRQIHGRYSASDPLLANLFARNLLSFNKSRLWYPSVRYAEYAERLDAYLFRLTLTPWERAKGWLRNRMGAERRDDFKAGATATTGG